jgi:hypothetical protein
MPIFPYKLPLEPKHTYLLTQSDMSAQVKSVNKKRGPGRPATGHDPLLATRVPAEVIAAIDAIAEQRDSSRAAITRELILGSLSELLETIHQHHKVLIEAMVKKAAQPDIKKQKSKRLKQKPAG